MPETTMASARAVCRQIRRMIRPLPLNTFAERMDQVADVATGKVDAIEMGARLMQERMSLRNAARKKTAATRKRAATKYQKDKVQRLGLNREEPPSQSSSGIASSAGATTTKDETKNESG